MRRIFLFFSIIVTLIILPTTNFSQEIPKLRADRPGQSKSSEVIPIDLFQIESGFIFQKQKYSKEGINFENENLIFASTLCRYGINSLFEFRFGGEYFMGESRMNGVDTEIQGLRNLLIGTKIQIRKDKKFITNLSVIIETVIPFGNERIRQDRFQPTFLLCMEQEFSKDISTGINIGAKDSNGFGNYFYLYSVILVYHLDQRFSSFIEIYGNKRKSFSPSNNIDCGLTYLVKQNIQIDVSAGTSLKRGETDLFGNIGFSVRLPR